jgi:hypothetical protein
VLSANGKYGNYCTEYCKENAAMTERRCQCDGTWNIPGTTITLGIPGAEHERLKNRSTSSTIVEFEADALVLKTDRGESSTFRRSARSSRSVASTNELRPARSKPTRPVP